MTVNPSNIMMVYSDSVQSPQKKNKKKEFPLNYNLFLTVKKKLCGKRKLKELFHTKQSNVVTFKMFFLIRFYFVTDCWIDSPKNNWNLSSPLVTIITIKGIATQGFNTRLSNQYVYLIQ